MEAEAVIDDVKALQEEFRTLDPIEQAVFNWQYRWHTQQILKHQVEPPGEWWSIWLMLAGRGAGKTRCAAETLAIWAWEAPNTRWLVAAPTSGDIRGTCFEGESGLLAVIPECLIAPEGYNRTLHELRLTNGSLIKGISATEPDRFRGAQWHGFWADELAAWDRLQEAWDMIAFSVRLGSRTKGIVTTTPKPKPLIMDLLAREGDDVAVTRASTYSNIKNLAPSFQKQILQYEGTNLGRQEIHAEIIDPEEGGIVKREWFRLWPNGKPFPKLEFILQSYDCATSDKTHNDPTGSITLGVFKPLDGGMCVMVLDCWVDHLTYPQLRPKVIEEFEVVYGEGKEKKRVDLLLVEDKSAGISLIQDLQQAELPVHAYNPGKADKIQRLSIVANIIKAGRVWVPESGNRKGYVRDWAEGMVSQICSFPEGTEHDEFVDCISQGLRYLRDGGWISIDIPRQDPFDDDDIYDADEYNNRSKANPYAL
jgi:phage terminase large subunit-like protein